MKKNKLNEKNQPQTQPEVETQDSTDSIDNQNNVEETQTCEAIKIAELEKQNEELKDKYLRLVAEYDNYRRRTAKERLELSENVKSNLFLDFLPVVDDMDRAVEHISKNIKAEDFEQNVAGIKLIGDKFHKFLASNGIFEIEAKGKDFDVDLHEAVTKFPVQDASQKGKVVDVVQTGYKTNDKVVRFAKVVVGE